MQRQWNCQLRHRRTSLAQVVTEQLTFNLVAPAIPWTPIRPVRVPEDARCEVVRLIKGVEMRCALERGHLGECF